MKKTEFQIIADTLIGIFPGCEAEIKEVDSARHRASILAKLVVKDEINAEQLQRLQFLGAPAFKRSVAGIRVEVIIQKGKFDKLSGPDYLEWKEKVVDELYARGYDSNIDDLRETLLLDFEKGLTHMESADCIMQEYNEA